MPLRLHNAKSVAHMPTAEQQQTKKDFKPRCKVDPAASPMPEIRLPERLATGRHQNRNAGRDHLGMLGEIKSEYPGEIVGIGTSEDLMSIGVSITLSAGASLSSDAMANGTFASPCALSTATRSRVGMISLRI